MTTLYQPIMFTFEAGSRPPGTTFNLVLAGDDNVPVAWSLGSPLDAESGILLTTENMMWEGFHASPMGATVPGPLDNPMPLCTFQITQSILTMAVGASGEAGPAQCKLIIFLAADPSIATYTLALQNDVDGAVYAHPMRTVGTQLSTTPGTFAWAP